MTGWIKLHRDLVDHPVFADESLLKVFLWCLVNANIETKAWNGTHLEAGQFATGRNTAAAQLDKHPSSVYRAFQRLEELGCINVTPNSHWTIITICNWSSYQDSPAGDRATREQSASNFRSSREQPASTTKESKNSRIQEQKERSPLPPTTGETCAAASPRGRFDPAGVEVPPNLQTPEFSKAWRDWIAHRRDIRKPLTSGSCGRQLQELARIGPHQAVAAIGRSILNGWTGIVFEETKHVRSRTSPGPGQRFDPASVGHPAGSFGNW